MKKILLFLLTAMFLCGFHLEAQTDNFIGAGSVSTYLTLGRGLSWSGQGFGTIGQNFIFHPVDANEGFCLFVYNNNPTNSHSFTVTVAQTGDPANQTYQNNISRWTAVPTVTSFPVVVTPTTLVGINYKTTASAGIAISFSGNAAAGGVPDTADVFTVQTNQSACGSISANTVQGPYQNLTNVLLAQQFPIAIAGYDNANVIRAILMGSGASNANTQVVTPASTSTNISTRINSTFQTFVGGANGTAGALQWSVPWRLSGVSGLVPGNLTDELRAHVAFSTAFYSTTQTTNPAAGTALFHFFCNGCSGSAQLTPVKLRIACQATTPSNCDFEIVRTTAAGTGCVAGTANNMLTTGSAASVVATIQSSCATTQPTVVANSTMFKEFILNNTTAVIDLLGYMMNGAQAGGILVRNTTAITSGQMNVTLEWAEE